MDRQPAEAIRPEELPVAENRRSHATWFFWLIPIAAALFVGWLIYSRTFGAGPTIHIRFPQAAGLQAGKSAVKLRGAVVGQVEKIELADDGESVEIEAQMDKGVKNIAREGAEFWIVKPEISAAQVSGLRTIVAGSYIGVKGTPVFYRGLKVGEVTAYGLGSDSQTLEITIDITDTYAPLVREDTKFWNVGGIKVNLGLLSGINVSVRSLKTLLEGGIAFATPEPVGKPAPPRTPFRLYDKPEDAWLTWMPRIPLGKHPPAATSLQK